MNVSTPTPTQTFHLLFTFIKRKNSFQLYSLPHHTRGPTVVQRAQLGLALVVLGHVAILQGRPGMTLVHLRRGSGAGREGAWLLATRLDMRRRVQARPGGAALRRAASSQPQTPVADYKAGSQTKPQTPVSNYRAGPQTGSRARNNNSAPTCTARSLRMCWITQSCRMPCRHHKRVGRGLQKHNDVRLRFPQVDVGTSRARSSESDPVKVMPSTNERATATRLALNCPGRRSGHLPGPQQ